ncbi:endonuclease/exonuclease/phosphatase family protein [Paenibacillus dakarensis]|uniref:endonuclease/exonuclease/phosphatase family protein n=1 Tax=Paenibacillus dakarensis TaxID=1527293 RepID=UPI001FE2248B|nr:endonuclease/exonuclease/phosphatase family protein [Paenibacillus dakarensis]
MNILQYNVLDGCQDEERLAGLDSWITSQPYDVIGFNELNGWIQSKLASYALRWGYGYSYVYETHRSKYYVGLVSKFPIEIISRTEEPFHHGLLHVKVNDVHFLITHLCPSDSLKRERETEYIAGIVRSITEPLLVMGDLNTLSPHDEPFYMECGIAHTLAQEDRLRKKFMHGGMINYKPMQILLDAGLSDAGHHSGQERELPFQYSVPTSVNQDHMHAACLRLDYVLVNESLRKRGPAASIVRDAHVDGLSDHYPIRCEWS